MSINIRTRFILVVFSTQSETALSDNVSLISAIEVFEHFTNPDADLKKIFQIEPEVIFATTELYSGEGAGWHYLSLKTGQHIFFYSEKSLRQFAEQNGYHYFRKGSFQVFTKKKLGAVLRLGLEFMLGSLGLRLARTVIALTYRTKHVEQDHRDLLSSLSSK